MGEEEAYVGYRPRLDLNWAAIQERPWHKKETRSIADYPPAKCACGIDTGMVIVKNTGAIARCHLCELMRRM